MSLHNLDSFLGFGTSVDMVNNDGAFVMLHFFKEDTVVPYLICRVVKPTKDISKLYYQIVHSSRDKLIDIEPSITNDLLYLLYREILLDTYDEFGDYAEVEYLEASEAEYLIEDFHKKFDRELITKAKHKLKSMQKHLRQLKGTTVLP